MILNFNFSLLALDGTEIPNSNAGKLIANGLSNSTKGDSLKYWDWATKLYKGDTLDLDPSDTQTLKGFIETHENFTVLSKAQCLTVFK